MFEMECGTSVLTCYCWKGKKQQFPDWLETFFPASMSLQYAKLSDNPFATGTWKAW